MFITYTRRLTYTVSFSKILIQTNVIDHQFDWSQTLPNSFDADLNRSSSKVQWPKVNSGMNGQLSIF